MGRPVRAAAGVGAALTVAAVTAAGITAAAAAPGSEARTGPTTTVKPYVLPVAPGVTVTSHLTVGDRPAGNGYRMVGIPDGIGLVDDGSTVDVLMNHELRPDQGTVRDHGQTGAFVSRLTLNPATGAVTAGDDLIKTVQHWNYATGGYGPVPVPPAGSVFPPQFARFCSGALTAEGQLRGTGGNGFDGRIYFANEEFGDDGRAFGVDVADGTAYQLPRLGLFSWENTLAAPTRGDATVVMGNEDAAAGQLRVYAGSKTAAGTPVDRAGLNNGTLSVVDVVDEAVTDDAQFRATYGKGRPAPVDLAPVDHRKNGKDQNADAAAGGLTLNRIEDGAFDPRTPNDYYFLTTEGGDRTPRPEVGGAQRDGGGLWRLSFEDVNRPELGGTLTLLLDGSEAPYLNKPDNMDIDAQGNLLIQEDPGNNASLARIVAYRIADGARGVVAQFDPALFTRPAAGSPRPSTIDEESSGILDASRVLGTKGTFVFDAQVHRPTGDPETVEEGQLLTLTVKAWGQVYTIKR